MSWEDEPARQLRVLRLASIMPLADAELASHLDPSVPDDRREITRINARLRERDLDIAPRGGRMTGEAALDYLNKMDELDRRSMDLELLDAYADALGVPITGVDFRP